MNKLILVKSTGNSTRGEVKESREVRLPTQGELEEAIRDGMEAIAAIASGAAVDDPTALKHCTRCEKLGRPFLHAQGEFSIVAKTGLRHSQCKKCRSEQASEWQATAGLKRLEYQRNYQKGYKRKSPKTRKQELEIAAMLNPEETKINGMDSMYIAVDTNKDKAKVTVQGSKSMGKGAK